jgi:uncharacterized protein (TIGR03382 family)
MAPRRARPGSPPISSTRGAPPGGLPAGLLGLLLGAPALAAPSHVLVGVDDPAALPAGQVEWLRGPGDVARLPVPAGADAEAYAAALGARPGLRWAHPDHVLPLTLHSVPDDSFAADQWHLENTGQSGGLVGSDVDAPRAWRTTTGEGAVVSVLDSGVDISHPDLNATCGEDFVDGDADCFPADGNAHGTAVAGIIAARANNAVGGAGIAWGAEVYGVRLIGGSTTTSDLYNAFVDSVDAGAWVLNNSWGFNNGCDRYRLWEAVDEAITYAETDGRGGLGALVVFSAGNGNCDNSGDGMLKHPLVVGVAAVDHADRREGYSSYGDGVDISGFAGGNIVTTDIVGDGGYGPYRGDPDHCGNFSGTSSAAPTVSGAAALLFAANPRLTAAEAREALCATAERVRPAEAEYDAEGWSPAFGCGRVDAGAAVELVANLPPGAPTPLGPAAPFESSVVLRWSAGVDPDGDPLGARLRWSADGGDEVLVELPAGQTELSLTGAVAVGQVVAWSVASVDAWGPGPEADGTAFTVAEAAPDSGDTGGAVSEDVPDDEVPDGAPPEADPADGGGEKGGCSTGGVAPAAALGLAAGLGLISRRRRRPAAG